MCFVAADGVLVVGQGDDFASAAEVYLGAYGFLDEFPVYVAGHVA